jgi:hypothetical protein
MLFLHGSEWTSIREAGKVTNIVDRILYIIVSIAITDLYTRLAAQQTLVIKHCDEFSHNYKTFCD